MIELSMLSYLNNIVAREISNGMWFISNLFLLFFLWKFLVPRVYDNPKFWDWFLSVKLAWGFNLIVLGSTIRSGWIWVLLMMENSGRDTTDIKATNSLTFFAIGFVLWGTICVIKALSVNDDGKERPIRWILATAFAVLIPVVIHQLL